MALVNDYSMQEDGVVLIGATELDNVTKVTVAVETERTVQTRAAFGGIRKIRGTGKVKLTVTMELYDESGIDGALNSFLEGDSTGTDQTITIRPLGTGAGLKELILNPAAEDYGMDLQSSTPLDASAGEDLPPVTGQMVWEGWFDERPAFTAQSA